MMMVNDDQLWLMMMFPDAEWFLEWHSSSSWGIPIKSWRFISWKVCHRSKWMMTGVFPHDETETSIYDNTPLMIVGIKAI